jgi:hypothetical protein
MLDLRENVSKVRDLEEFSADGIKTVRQHHSNTTDPFSLQDV